jgi:CheY-like chemotaxis protein
MPASCPPPETDPLRIAMLKIKEELSGFQRPVRILFTDDDAGMRILFGRLAADFNCEVSYAACGCDGLAAALTGNFDLVILDIKMPDLSGIEVFRVIRQRLGDLPPVAFFTGALDDREGLMISEIGFASFIRKPHELNGRFMASFFHNFRIFRKPVPAAGETVPEAESP